MKNIGRVFWNDCKHIGRNVVALIVVMGLAVLPSLYAWPDTSAARSRSRPE